MKTRSSETRLASKKQMPVSSRILRLFALLPMIRLHGNALTVRFPITPRAFAQMMDPGSSDARLLTEFRRQGGRITMTNDLVTFSLGAPTNAVTALTLPMAKKPYVPNAVDAVRKRASIREKFDASSAAREFLNPPPAATAGQKP